MKKRKLIVIVPVIVVILGMIGYTQEGTAFYEALLSSLNLLKVNFENLPRNAFIEAGRWLGVFFFFGLLYAAVSAVLESGIVFAKSKIEDAVAIHGNSVYANVLKDALGRRGIYSEKRTSFGAPIQVIMFEDDKDAIEFYQRNAAELDKAKSVHICLKLGNHIKTEKDNVFFSNLSEIRAVDYWTNHYCTQPERIVIIGSGQLAEAVLQWGLLTNIFDVNCGNSYHVFGDFDRYSALHGNIKDIISEFGGDELVIETGKWYSNLDSIRLADRIIICGETSSNIETASSLKDYGVKCPIHMFAEQSRVASLLDKGITPVGTLSKDKIADMIIMDSIHDAGKLCHATYMLTESSEDGAVSYNDVESFIGTKEFISSWRKMDAFTRGSNYVAAIHDPLKHELLMKSGLDVTGMTAAENAVRYDALPHDTKERLQEIEHIRWSRYHLLNYWRKPDETESAEMNGRRKDPVHKLHADLVPYSDLRRQEKEKDEYFYKTLSLRIKSE